MKKVVRIYLAMILLAIGMVLATMYVNGRVLGDWSFETCSDYELCEEERGNQKITIWLSEKSGTGQGRDVVFYTSHQFVHVYADGTEIYRVTENGGRLSRTPGNVWNFVPIPCDTKKLEIHLQNVYHTTASYKPVFYLGQSIYVFRYLYSQSALLEMIGSCIGIAGILLLLSGVLLEYKKTKQPALIYLGLFACIFGVWSSTSLNGMRMIFPYHIVTSAISFLTLALLPIPFVLYVRAYFSLAENKLWKVVCGMSICTFFLSFILQLLGMKDFKETVIGTHVTILLSMGYVLFVLAQQMKCCRKNKKLQIFLLASAVIVVSLLIDMYGYYTKILYNVGVVTHFGLLLFVVLLGFVSVEDAKQMMLEGKQAKLYKDMATLDKVTGLYSRNAYEMEVKSLDDMDNVCVVMFDLNNLKQCNDTCGHEMGDLYLRNAAACIRKIFGPYGACYRIGGDEFCCIMKDSLTCNLRELVDQMRIEEEKYDAIMQLPNRFEIACGYARYHNKWDRDFESVRSRADEMLYQNKAELKAKSR